MIPIWTLFYFPSLKFDPCYEQSTFAFTLLILWFGLERRPIFLMKINTDAFLVSKI